MRLQPRCYNTRLSDFLGMSQHLGEEVGIWRSHQTKSARNKGAVGRLIALDLWGNFLIANGAPIPRSATCNWFANPRL